MYGQEKMRWKRRLISKDETEGRKKTVDGIGLGDNRPTYAATEVLRGEGRLSTFEKRIEKSVLKYKVRL